MDISGGTGAAQGAKARTRELSSGTGSDDQVRDATDERDNGSRSSRQEGNSGGTGAGGGRTVPAHHPTGARAPVPPTMTGTEAPPEVPGTGLDQIPPYGRVPRDEDFPPAPYGMGPRRRGGREGPGAAWASDWNVRSILDAPREVQSKTLREAVRHSLDDLFSPLRDRLSLVEEALGATRWSRRNCPVFLPSSSDGKCSSGHGGRRHGRPLAAGLSPDYEEMPPRVIPERIIPADDRYRAI